MSRQAFAYIERDGTVDVETISTSLRGAMIKCVTQGSFGHVRPTEEWSGADLSAAVVNITGGQGRVAEIAVAPKETAS